MNKETWKKGDRIKNSYDELIILDVFSDGRVKYLIDGKSYKPKYTYIDKLIWDGYQLVEPEMKLPSNEEVLNELGKIVDTISGVKADDGVIREGDILVDKKNSKLEYEVRLILKGLYFLVHNDVCVAPMTLSEVNSEFVKKPKKYDVGELINRVLDMIGDGVTYRLLW